jgi:hypothetical protein
MTRSYQYKFIKGLGKPSPFFDKKRTVDSNFFFLRVVMATLFEQVMFHYDKGIIFFDNGKAAIVTYNSKCHLWGEIENDEVDEIEYYNVQEIEILGDHSEVRPLRNFNWVKTIDDVNKILGNIKEDELEKIQWDERARHGTVKFKNWFARIHKTGEFYDIECYGKDDIDIYYDFTEGSLKEILSHWWEREEEE